MIMETKIHLSQKSIRQIAEICDTVEENCSDNEMSLERAAGIRGWAQDKQFVTEGQRVWLAWNAKMQSMSLPDELADLSPPISGRGAKSGTPRVTVLGNSKTSVDIRISWAESIIADKAQKEKPRPHN